MRLCFIGIDIGTTVSKGAVIDNKGEILARHQVCHKYSNYDDYSDAWWDEVIQIVGELSTRISDKSSICNITISAMVPNLIMLDSEGNLACKTRLYIDDFALEKQKMMDSADGTKWKNETLSKIIVLKEKEHNWEKVAHILTTHCFIGYKFTGNYYCDLASAYEYGHVFNTSSRDWNGVLLAKHNIDCRVFPPLVSSISCVGSMDDNVADLLNLPHGIEIIAGSHDSVASMIGAGLSNKGDNLLYYGTFNCSAVIHYDIIDVLRGNTDSSPIEWTSSIPDSGPQFAAMCKLLTGTEDYEQYDKFASMSHPGANGVVFLQNPHLLSTSISSVADGAFFHITNRTTVADLCRAVYEAFPYGVLAFWESNSDFSKPTCCFASGGGVRSNLRVQIVSDVLSLKQYKLEFAENAVGTALIGVAAFSQTVFTQVQNTRREQATMFYPDTTHYSTYREIFKEYQRLLYE